VKKAAAKPKPKKSPTKSKAPKGPHAVRDALLKYALSLPGAWEDHPWGETVAKVGKKVFLFSGVGEDGVFGFSAKLPESNDAALATPGAAPTGYGLGQAGWVSIKCSAKDVGNVGMYRAWVEESYRAVAPKKLIKELDGTATTTARKA